MIILDTNVISESMRKLPEGVVMSWLDAQPAADLFTTAITKAEIFNGIDLMPSSKRSSALLVVAERILEGELAGRVLPFDHAAARWFAQIFVARKNRGKPIDPLDAQIAGIVRSHNATLATRNTRDFEDCGIHLINPWQSVK
jgi:predicted nucleic acid-binding protein